ncbi:MAG: hypothetical protein JWM91_3784 [Rhodospirillales bacterium]|nr:hypothetical protein [Rhodospirillales bacterium]
MKETSVCVVDDAGKVLCERKVPTEPDDIIVLLTSVGGEYVRVGIEAGRLFWSGNVGNLGRFERLELPQFTKIT